MYLSAAAYQPYFHVCPLALSGGHRQAKAGTLQLTGDRHNTSITTQLSHRQSLFHDMQKLESGEDVFLD